jgi:hypothetical protein
MKEAQGAKSFLKSHLDGRREGVGRSSRSWNPASLTHVDGELDEKISESNQFPTDPEGETSLGAALFVCASSVLHELEEMSPPPGHGMQKLVIKSAIIKVFERRLCNL